MSAVRRDILGDDGARDAFIDGVGQLKHEFLGPTTADLGIGGPPLPLSTYDLFVAWHHAAMDRFTPPTQGDRNAAHRGPVFLPWHRFMLILLEFQLQRVLGDQDFGLPYWDWAADGELAPADQPGSPLWGEACMGGDGDPVSTGPFAFAEGDPKGWRVLLDVDVQGELRPVDRGLRRSFGRAAPTLPTKAQVAAALALDTYDVEPWGTTSAGLRNRLEGWRPAAAAPGLHNRVHVWVGGDMLPSSSPNDPVFYLNHANIDRVWAAWQAGPTAGPYLPGPDAAAELRGHRLDDPVFSLLTDPATPRQLLDVGNLYTYDTLIVS